MMEKIIGFVLILVMCALVALSVFTIIEGGRKNEQREAKEFEKNAVDVNGEIMKTEKVEQGVREVTVKATEGENTVIIKFFVYKEDNFTGKAGERFSGKISSDNIVSSETVKTEIKTEKEQN